MDGTLNKPQHLRLFRLDTGADLGDGSGDFSVDNLETRVYPPSEALLKEELLHFKTNSIETVTRPYCSCGKCLPTTNFLRYKSPDYDTASHQLFYKQSLWTHKTFCFDKSTNFSGNVFLSHKRLSKDNEGPSLPFDLF